MKFPQKRLNEKQLMTISISCGSLVLVLIGALLYVVVTGFDEVKAQNIQLKAERDGLEDKKRQLKPLKEEIDSLEKEVQVNVTMLPSETDVKVEEFIHFLDTAAEGTRFEEFRGISLEKFEKIQKKKTPASPRRSAAQPATPVQKTHFKKHEYNVLYRGAFFQFGKFINIIESDDRFMSIEAFRVEQPKNPLDPVLEIYLKIVTFTYEPKGVDAQTGASQ